MHHPSPQPAPHCRQLSLARFTIGTTATRLPRHLSSSHHPLCIQRDHWYPNQAAPLLEEPPLLSHPQNCCIGPRSFNRIPPPSGRPRHTPRPSGGRRTTQSLPPICPSPSPSSPPRYDPSHSSKQPNSHKRGSPRRGVQRAFTTLRHDPTPPPYRKADSLSLI